MSSYDIARSILGKDFISPEQIATALGLSYTRDQLVLLSKKLPDQSTLEAIRDAGMMLVAGPTATMSMLDIYTLSPDYFYPYVDDDGELWYGEYYDEFDGEIEALCWLALRKEPVDGSLLKNWEEQKVLVSEPLYVPNVAEVTWGLMTYKAVNDVYTLPEANCDIYVSTSSLGSDDGHVTIGTYGTILLDVDDTDWDGDRYDNLGVLAARKF